MSHVLGPYRYWFFLFVLVLIVIEGIWVFRKRRDKFNLKESLSNTVILAGYIMSKALTVGYQLAVLGFVSNFAFLFWHSSLPIFLTTGFISFRITSNFSGLFI